MKRAMTRKLTSKGRVTIPQALRDELGLSLGDRVAFTRSPDGDLVVKKSLPREKLFGLMDEYSNPKQSVSLDGVDAAVLEAAQKE